MTLWEHDTLASTTVSEAEAELPALLEQAAAGHEVVITRDGKPLARVLPAELGPINREPGVLGWTPGSYDPAIFNAMTDAETEAEGWS